MAKIPNSEQIIALVLRSLSLGSFILLILLIIPITTFFALPFVMIFSSLLGIYIIHKIFKTRHIEEFNLTSPTSFKTGALIFKSCKNQYAIFVSFALILTNKIVVEKTHQTLTILLKVLPDASVLSVEWLSQRKCYINFYIKSKESAFLSQTKELISSVQSSFEKILGQKNVRLLQGNELLIHLSYGIQGRIQKIKTANNTTVWLETDLTKTSLSASYILSFQRNQLHDLLKETENARIILSLKKENSHLSKIKNLVLILSDSNKPAINQNLFDHSFTFTNIPSSVLIRSIGDFLTRSFEIENYQAITYKEAMDDLQRVSSSTFIHKQNSVKLNSITSSPNIEQPSP